MKILNTYFWVCLCIFLAKKNTAQIHTNKWFTTKNGLVNNRCGNISQDGAGYMWIGTDNGICNFNGKDFNFFKGKKSTYYWGQSCATRHKQYAVLGSAGQGLALCYKNSIRFIGQALCSQISINGGVSINDTTFLVSTHSQVKILSENTIHDIVLPLEARKKGTYFTGIFQDKELNIYIYASNGLLVFLKGDTNRCIWLSQMQGKYINSVFQAKDGHILITNFKNLYRCNDTEFISTSTFTKVYESKFIITCAENIDSDKIIIGGCYYPALVLNKNFNIITSLTGEKTPKNIWTIFCDRENNIWLTSDDGVYEFTNLSATVFPFYDTKYYNIRSGEFIGNDFWITNGVGQYYIKDNILKQFSCTESSVGLLNQRCIYTNDGKYFLNNSKIDPRIKTTITYEFKRQGDRLIENASIQKKYNGPVYMNMDQYSGNQLGHNFFTDENYHLWFYCNGHMTQCKADDQDIHTVNALCINNTKQEIWIADNTFGIKRYSYVVYNNECFLTLRTHLKNNSLKPNDNYTQLLLDKNENLWVGTTTSGLLSFIKQTNSSYIQNLEQSTQKFTSNFITVLSTNGNDNCIWVGTNQGLHKLTYTQLPYFNVSTNVFSENLTGKYIYFIKEKNKQLYVGTTGSVAHFDLASTNISPNPLVNINKISINGFENDSILNSTKKIELQNSENNIRFEFQSSSYAGENQYSYFLEGSDKNWNTTLENSITYNQLIPGEYILHVKTKNSNNLQSDKEAIFSFTIIPPYYQKWWFKVLCCLAIALVLYRLYRFRVQQILKLHNARNTISKDLHDDIGTSLSSITMMNELMKNKIKTKPDEAVLLATKMEIQSREMIQNMNDIVWSINPNNDNVELLITRLNQFASDAFDTTDTNYKINLEQHGATKINGLSVRRDMYMICKEIIANTAKYALAKHFTLQLILQKNTIEIISKDDGIGFDETLIKKGNGLQNIKKRVASQKGKYTLKHATNAGVEWHISFPPNESH